jgi:hypothetical protein
MRQMPVITQHVEGLAPDLDRRLRRLLSEILVTPDREWNVRVRWAQGGAFVKLDVKGSRFAWTVWICHEDLAFQPELVRQFLERAFQEDGTVQTELREGIR